MFFCLTNSPNRQIILFTVFENWENQQINTMKKLQP